VLIKPGIDLADGKQTRTAGTRTPDRSAEIHVPERAVVPPVPDLPLGGAKSRPGISDTSPGWVKQTQVIRQLERENGAYPPAARHWNRVVVLTSVPLMNGPADGTGTAAAEKADLSDPGTRR
jgi:hypothetical protein